MKARRQTTILDEQPRKPLGDRTIEHRYGALALVNEPFELGPKSWVVRGQLREHGGTQLKRRIEHSVDERRELLPSVGQQRRAVALHTPSLIVAVAHNDSALRKSIRAFAQSR